MNVSVEEMDRMDFEEFSWFYNRMIKEKVREEESRR